MLYAGNASSYVRSITSLNGVTYVGGDFGSFGGQSRSHAAALSATFGVTSWNPKPSATVRALAAAGSSVFMGGSFSAVRAVSSSTGSTIWSKSTSGGDVHSLLATNGTLYAGGLFEKYNGTTQHGLVEINPSSGSLVTAFNAHLRADTGVGVSTASTTARRSSRCRSARTPARSSSAVVGTRLPATHRMRPSC